MSEKRIFISYRREGGDHLAGRIAGSLRDLGYTVFYDMESMRAGRFDEQIREAICASDHILTILTRNSLDCCSDPEDWVRREIECAIGLGKQIISVMTPDFRMPERMPGLMASFGMHHGIYVYPDYYESMIDKLNSLLEGRSAGMMEGLRLLKLGLHAQALVSFEKALRTNVPDPDAYFYAAAAMLKGKRPFLADRKTIQAIEEYLTAASRIEDRPVYSFFLAYVKYDYYHRKMLRTTPDHTKLLRHARERGLTPEQIGELFSLLQVSRPAGI